MYRNEQAKYFSYDEIQEAIKNNRIDQLRTIPLAVGEYCSDREYAQEVCVMLLKNKYSEVRANAVLGLSYVAKNHRFLSREIEELLANEYQTNMFYREKIRYYIEDICLFLNWNADKILKRGYYAV